MTKNCTLALAQGRFANIHNSNYCGVHSDKIRYWNMVSRMKPWLSIRTWFATLTARPLSILLLMMSIPDVARFIERKEEIERILLRCTDCRIYVDKPHLCELHEPMIRVAGRKDFDIAAWEP